MKEMEYSLKTDVILLYFKDYGEGIKGVILNIRGSHPCVYVTCPDMEKVEDYDSFNLTKMDPHGGFTYLGDLKHVGIEDGIYIGWDYAHYGDYTYSEFMSLFPNGHDRDKKYTTKELIEDLEAVVNEIKERRYEIY